MTLALGIDPGGTTLRGGVVDGLEVIEEVRATPRLGAACAELDSTSAKQLVADALAGFARDVLARHPGIHAIGVGAPGYVSADGRVLRGAPNLPGVTDAELADALSAATSRPVRLENDALAAAWGEYLLDAQSPDLIYLGLGTGIGGGLVLGGRPWRGTTGMAMEFGHIIVEPGGRSCGCGNRGCVERYASASGLRISYALSGGGDLDASEIAARARAGESMALQAFAVAAGMLASACAHLVKITDVRNLVIGGGLSAAWDQFEPNFPCALDAQLLAGQRGSIRVRPSTADDRAGILGAARLALDTMS